MYKWRFKNTTEYKDSDFPFIAKTVIEIFYDGMGEGEWSWPEEEIFKQLKSSTILGLLEDGNKNVGGYCFATIPTKKFKKKNLLWIDACSVSKNLQQNGFFVQGIATIKELYQNCNFGFIGGRSQNPIVFYMFDKLSSLDFYPFGTEYTSKIINFLKKTIKNEVYEPSINIKQNLNVKNGIITNAYWGKKLGDYKINFKNNIIIKYEEMLLNWNFNRFNGDTVILFKEL